MGYWGWRPLICGVFISAWVVGCNIIPDNTDPSAAAPSSYPNVTLTVGRLPTIGLSPPPTQAMPNTAITAEPTAVATTSPDATRQNILTRESPLNPSPTALPLHVQAPTCYETRPDNLLCLGRVDNPLDFPVESVSVEVSLAQPDGTIALRRATVEQMSIPAGSFAPYQATFEVAEGDFGDANADLVSAARGTDDGAEILIQNAEGEIVDGRVVVSVVLYNPASQPVEILRVFVTLLDSAGSVIGYRVVVFEAETILDGGDRFPLRIELTPQVSDATPEYVLYVEARAIED